MTGTAPLVDVIRKRLQSGILPFCEFMEIALYEPGLGYYSRGGNRVGKEGDYVTSPTLSPLFSFALGKLMREFLSRVEGEPSTVVDIGCGDGSLIYSLYGLGGGAAASPAQAYAASVAGGAAGAPRFYGVDRSLSRVSEGDGVRFVHSLDEVPKEGAHLIFANELFDAFPFARLVKRAGRLCELCVVERSGALDWSERAAPPEYERYFADRGVELADGQFADVSLDWEREYTRICRSLMRGLIITFDYGYPEKNLFDNRARRYGTAASYRGHEVSRDLLSDPGERDLTAHINFTDLSRAGEREGFTTLFFDRQAKFLLALGAAEHESLRPIDDMAIGNIEEGLLALQHRDDARRMLLPDGIG
ncbi:MAG TPA: SAM-dependent methyltransferase, partial [Thermoanaerobaculia bacterium]